MARAGQRTVDVEANKKKKRSVIRSSIEMRLQILNKKTERKKDRKEKKHKILEASSIIREGAP